MSSNIKERPKVKFFKLKNVRQEWEEVDADKITKIVFLISAVIYLLTLGFFLYNRRLLPPELPIFYSKPWGQERLAGSDAVWIPVVIGLVLLIINGFLSLKVFAKEKFLQKIIAWTNLTTTAMISVTLLKIMRLFV
jgi:hypothetical protein